MKTLILGKPSTPGLKKNCMIDLLVRGHENDPSLEDLQGTRLGARSSQAQ